MIFLCDNNNSGTQWALISLLFTGLFVAGALNSGRVFIWNKSSVTVKLTAVLDKIRNVQPGTSELFTKDIILKLAGSVSAMNHKIKFMQLPINKGDFVFSLLNCSLLLCSKIKKRVGLFFALLKKKKFLTKI